MNPTDSLLTARHSGNLSFAEEFNNDPKVNPSSSNLISDKDVYLTCEDLDQNEKGNLLT